MGRRRRTLVVGAVSGAMAAVVCGAMIAHYVAQAEWWQVRHTVTSEPIAPQEPLGPPEGPITVSWQRSAPVGRGSLAGHDSVAYDIAHGQLVTASGRGLEVRDARTGSDRWSYRRNGWDLLGWTSTRSRLIGYFERSGHRGERQMVGFDALSGAMLWRRGGAEPAAVSRTTLRWPAGSDVVLTAEDDRRTVAGRSAADGSRVWSRSLPPGCRLFEGAAHGSGGVETRSVLPLDCAGASRLLAVEPAGGRVVWSRALGSAEAPEVAAHDGVTLVSDGTGLLALDEKGEKFASWPGPDVCGAAPCPAVVAGGRLIVVQHPEPAELGSARMDAVEVASGRALWRRDVPEYAALTQAAGEVYALRPRLAEGLLPAGVDAVDPGDGRTRTVPAPFAVDPDLGGVRPWMAAAGGLLYVAIPEAAPRPAGAGHLFALRGASDGPGPAELDGVAVREWPDACGLLTRGDLASARLSGSRVRAGMAKVGEVRLPKPVSCTYEPREPPVGLAPPETGDADPDERGRDSPSPSRWDSRGPTVTVKWVAPAGASASGLLETLRAAQSQARRRTDLGGDEAYEIGPTPGTIALRVDRYIVVVSASNPPSAAPRLARTIASRLTARSAGPTGLGG
ncbi:PQQ-binding-like beta-propeller repeat protein [Spirillospora sp. CA-294931]|uniref:outer membrane protein assembly factor BamB family protein n=1 Tax=Spirillospora sp. CA-294931 TaxID=3240042 RepID=UPI003D930D58